MKAIGKYNKIIALLLVFSLVLVSGKDVAMANEGNHSGGVSVTKESEYAENVATNGAVTISVNLDNNLWAEMPSESYRLVADNNPENWKETVSEGATIEFAGLKYDKEKGTTYSLYKETDVDTEIDVTLSPAENNVNKTINYYTVSFISEGTPKKQYILDGQCATEPQISKPEFELTGWYTSEGCLEENKVEDVNKFPITGVTSFYAGWKAKEHTATVLVKKDDEVWNAVSPEAISLRKDGGEIKDAEKVENGYSFRGVVAGIYNIYVDASDTNIDIIVGEEEENKAVINYYTVSFYDGETLLSEPEEKIVLSGTQIASPSALSDKEECKFLGWVAQKDGDAGFEFDKEVITGKTELYAKWETVTAPSAKPSTTPSEGPSTTPSEGPSTTPSEGPSTTPSEGPSTTPSEGPSTTPSEGPSTTPSEGPSTTPSEGPSTTPSTEPNPPSTTPGITAPTVTPTQVPAPTVAPTEAPKAEISLKNKAITLDIGKSVVVKKLFSNLTGNEKVKVSIPKNCTKYLKYKNGKLVFEKNYKVKLAKSAKVKITVDGKAYTVNVKLRIPAPKGKDIKIIINKRKDNNGRPSHKFLFKYNFKGATKIKIRLLGKNIPGVNNYFDKYLKSSKSNSKSYILFTNMTLKSMGNKLKLKVVVYYGKNQTESLIITKKV